MAQITSDLSIDSQNWGLLVLKTYVFLSQNLCLWASFAQLIIWTFLFYAFAPQQIFTSIYKKNPRLFLKTKKIRAVFRKYLVIFLDFSLFCTLSWFSWISFDFIKGNVRNIMKILKKSKISKIHQKFSENSSNFFRFQKKIDDFFYIDRCKNLLRSECTYLERPNN